MGRIRPKYLEAPVPRKPRWRAKMGNSGRNSGRRRKSQHSAQTRETPIFEDAEGSILMPTLSSYAAEQQIAAAVAGRWPARRSKGERMSARRYCLITPC